MSTNAAPPSPPPHHAGAQRALDSESLGHQLLDSGMTDLIERRRGTTGVAHKLAEPGPIARHHGGTALYDPSRLLDDVPHSLQEGLRQGTVAIKSQ